MQDSMLYFLKSYLTGRKFRLKLESHFSDWKPLHAGVPQGSILAPLLYNVYVSDIFRRPGIEILQFADDTAAYTSNKGISYAISNVQGYRSDLEVWICKWRLKNQCRQECCCNIYKKRRQIPRNRLKLFETEIPWSRMAKYLGMHLEKSLTWNTHIKAMTSKTMQRLLALYCIFKCRNRNRKTHLYKSVIRPILLYGAPACGYAANSNMKKPQTIQNKILRTIYTGDRHIRNTTIHTTLNIRTVYEEIARATAKFTNASGYTFRG
jgi:hypothetical protein